MRTAKIVLIEDSPADIFLIEMALKESEIPYELTKFKNGEDAIGALCAPEGQTTNTLCPDAIFLDLHTPRSDGFLMLEKLRRTPHLAEVPIAILTSSQSTSDKNRVGLLAHTRYIEKSGQLEQFLTTVGQAIKEMTEVTICQG
jgi:chemotaxis family two-component system response regulator Rcp1